MRLARVLGLVVVVTCGDAPRDNPLDPAAGVFSPVGGVVVTRALPRVPLAGVRVEAIAFGVADTTDALGKFWLPYLPPESLVVVAWGQGFAPCSVWVPARGQPRTSLELALNAVPRITACSVTSWYAELWWPEPHTEWVWVRATVVDADGPGDIAGVWCHVQGKTVPLAPEGSSTYGAVLDQGTWSGFRAEDLVGSPFVFVAEDASGTKGDARETVLVRVVRDVGTPLSPVGLEQVPSSPLLRWVPPNPPYQASVRVRVVRVDSGVERLAWESPSYPVGADTARVEVALSVGTYYWIVQTLDGFGNVGNSKEAAFRVAP